MYPVWEQLGIAHELDACIGLLHDAGPDRTAVREHIVNITDRIDGLVAEAERLLPDMGNGNNKNKT